MVANQGTEIETINRKRVHHLMLLSRPILNLQQFRPSLGDRSKVSAPIA